MEIVLERLPYLTRRVGEKLSDRLRTVASVRSRHRGLIRQLWEASLLRLGPTRAGMGDYLSQGMYNTDLYPERDLASMGGWAFKEHVHAQLNNMRWEGMVTDKLILYALFEQFKLPYPKVHAAAWKRARSLGETPVFHDPETLAQYLRQRSWEQPLFCKPVKGSYGRGSARIENYLPESDGLLLSDGSECEVLPFLLSLQDDGWGYLFQEAMAPSPLTLPMCGDAVSGCRVVMLLDDEGARPFKVVWKIPRGRNHSDNWGCGKLGNMVAAIDVDSGKVVRVVSGAGVEVKIDRPHPDTGFDFLGVKVPQWDSMMTLMKRAAECFPGFRWQNWDVGITARGPVLYELNSAGHVDVLQMAYGKGINDAELKTFLSRHGGREPVPGPLF